MYDYVIAGLTVVSDLVLQSQSPVEPVPVPDVVVCAGEVPPDLAMPTLRGPTWQLTKDRLLLTIPGIVRLLLTEGREIRYALAPGVAPDEAAIFISGTGFGLLLHQRGCLVLHASAVRVGRGAVLFCGPSGAGKSTLAAALVVAGHDLLSDDLCCLTIGEGQHPLVQPDGRRLKLWQNAIGPLALEDRKAGPVRPDVQKYYVEPRSCHPAALPLLAIYELREARPPHVAGIERANLVDGAVLVRDNAYRPSMLRRMGLADLYFRGSVGIVQRAGCFYLTRNLGFAEMPMVVRQLEAHWGELGWAEDAA